MKWSAWAVESSKGEQREALVLVTAESGSDEVRAPLLMNLALDRSASMKGAPLGAAVEAAQQIVDMTGPEDYLGLVLFDGIPDQRVPVCRMDAKGKKAMHDALTAVQVGRGTALYQALDIAAKGLTKMLVPGRHPTLLVLTDGEPSVGPDDVGDFEALGQRLAKDKVSVHALGLARHYVAEVLEGLTKPSGNAYSHVDGPEGLSEAMGDVVASLLGQVATGVSVRAEPTGFAALECRHGYQTGVQDGALVISVGDVSRGVGRRVLLAGQVLPGNWELMLHGSSVEHGDQRHQRIEVERLTAESARGRVVQAVGHELDVVAAETAAWLSLARKDLDRAEELLGEAEEALRALVALAPEGFPSRRHLERLGDLRMAVERGEGDIPLLVRRAKAAREKTSVSQVIPMQAYRNRK